MTTEWVEDKQAKINKMDFWEAQDYRAEVAASCLDNPKRFFLYDLCDARIQSLNPDTALAAYDDSGFEYD